MFYYANCDNSPISQTLLNRFTSRTKLLTNPIKDIDIEYNVCYTVFDYLVDKELPPCIHFLDNFLSSEVYVFSTSLSSNLLSKVDSKSMVEDYITQFTGSPKTAINNDYELGWVGIEKSKDCTIMSNIQINGIYRKSLTRRQEVDFYRTMVNFCRNEIKIRPLYAPTAKTLKSQMNKMSNHPDSAIMESPYTSKILKGFKKTKLQIDGSELEFYKSD